MIFALYEDGQFVRKVASQNITINKIQYPAAIFRVWEDHELAAIGLYPCDEAAVTPEEQTFTEITYEYELIDGRCVETYTAVDLPNRAELELQFNKVKAQNNLRNSDLNDVPRLAEDVYDALVAKGVLSDSDLPTEAQTKLNNRRNYRATIKP